MGPSVTGDLMAPTIHSSDYFIPAVFGIVNWTFGFVDTSGCSYGSALEWTAMHGRQYVHLRYEKGCLEMKLIQNVKEFTRETMCTRVSPRSTLKLQYNGWMTLTKLTCMARHHMSMPHPLGFGT